MQTLLFDFGGTLDADGVAWKERFHGLYRAEGLELEADAFAPVFYAADDLLVGGLHPDAELSETVRRLAQNLDRELATRTGDSTPRAARVADAFLSETAATLSRNIPVLEALGRRYRLGIVSNFYGNLPAVCRGCGLAPLFGAVADSEVVGIGKPDPEIFRAAMDPLGALPATTIMVGDSLHRDREGARRSGLGFIWVAPEDAPPASRAEPLDHPVVARLDLLAELLL